VAAVGVFCASSTRIEQRWLDLATDTGKELAARGHTLISGGGRVGMMGTVAAGARSGGAHTVGVIPQTLVDWEVADTDSDELIVTDGMGSRKNLLIERSDAFITLPGGLGTLDELFEVWTTATLDLHRKPIVLLDPDGFYRPLLSWLSSLAESEFVRPEALSMVTVVDTVPAALDTIEAQLHVDRFNEAVATGDWSSFLALFAPDAVMTFDGPPVGPYQGIDAIAEGYATQPPTDTMTIRDVNGKNVDFAWSRGGTGTMTIERRDGLITHLAIAFHSAPA